tara:strand:- start:18 stop:212 length:195 start_codon:yes stop_codon:yes gene_type:complete
MQLLRSENLCDTQSDRPSRHLIRHSTKGRCVLLTGGSAELNAATGCIGTAGGFIEANMTITTEA